MNKVFNSFDWIFAIFMSLSFIFMLGGHVALHGDPFGDSGELFNPKAHFVSNYAADSSKGWIIKSSIVSFCVAVLIFGRQLANSSANIWSFFRKLFWIISIFGMISGLVLVIIFDIQPPKQIGMLQQILQHIGFSNPLNQKGMIEHCVGFNLFSLSSFSVIILDIAGKCYRRDFDKLATSVVTIIVMYSLTYWLGHNSGYPGVPQRFFILAVAFHICRPTMGKLFPGSKNWLPI